MNLVEKNIKNFLVKYFNKYKYMQSIVINSSNANTSENHFLRYHFTKPMKLPLYCKLAHASFWYNWNNIHENLKNNTYKINDRNIVIPNGSYSINFLNQFIKYELERTEQVELDHEILVLNVATNRIMLETGEHIKYISFAPELCYWLGIIAHKPSSAYVAPHYEENQVVEFQHLPHIEVVSNVLIHSNIVDNAYQLESKLLYSFVPNQEYNKLLYIEPKSLWKQTRNAEEYFIDIYLTDQDNKPLLIEDSMSFTIVLAEERFVKN